MALIDLKKKAGIVLTKRKMKTPPVTRVGLAIDASLSMTDLYMNGVVQRQVDRILAVGSHFDDDGNIDMWRFDGGCARLPQAAPEDYGNYLNRHSKLIGATNLGRSTSYAPFMQDAGEFYFPPRETAAPGLVAGIKSLFGRKPPAEAAAPAAASIPALMLPITDGENQDKSEVISLIRSSQNLPIYWQFCGIGTERFGFLKRLADDYPNVGFCKVPDLGGTSDEEFFDMLLSEELVEWVRKFEAPAAGKAA